MPDPIDLEALEAKAKAATAGPWMLDGMGEDEPEINYWAHLFIGTAEPNESGSHEVIATSEDKHGPNAEYIAAAHPGVVLALIAELRELLAHPLRHLANDGSSVVIDTEAIGVDDA